ncbi:alpha/beta hydrolase [Nocardia arthritidis]|uniref:Alpha/beta fold hydrolase n=1 Tax=Nocardia arthritidis TaxID=228602 RepID=A0A6G9YBY8_9NOCA|nr:alpha/beta fold hydrolase [Nocardia arthritidis]QIS10722.1 alpha/beta fold hydrolase [Nocardia arthritidis]
MTNVRQLHTGLAVAEERVAGAPAVVLLHGFGKYHGHLLDLWPRSDMDWSVAAVRAGFRMGPAVYRWFGYEDLPDGSVAIAMEEERRSRAALIAYLDEIRRDEPLFLFGHSQGGMMALSVALLRPDLIAGCAVVNGRILPETLALLPERPDLDGMPVFVGHGISDPVVKIDKGRNARDLLEDMGAGLTYREYRGGHDITPDMVADVVAWVRITLAQGLGGRCRERPGIGSGSVL